VVRFNGAGHSDDIAYNVAVQRAGCGIVLAGVSQGGTGATRNDFATMQGPVNSAVPGPILTPAIADAEDQESGDAEGKVPGVFALYNNYPNPFNPTTILKFNLPTSAFVTLKVYNTLGQEVRTLLNHQEMNDGVQEVEFNANALASGVYFYRIVAVGIPEEDGVKCQTFTSVKKMVLVK
jgi:hypothetical protein